MINKVFNMDCVEGLSILEDNSVDSIVTDPPYEIGFMGKSWDSTGVAYNVELWKQCLRVLKPGGHLLSFGGTRTYHRMACAIEDAGFEIRDSIHWVYSQGFPKSMDVSKAIDKGGPRKTMFEPFAKHYGEQRKIKGLTHSKICEAGKFYNNVNHGGASTNWEVGYNVPTVEQWEILQPLLELSLDFLPLIKREEAEREILSSSKGSSKPGFSGERFGEVSDKSFDITAPATPEAQQWQGYGTALKPAHEPIVLARKPISEKTIASNVLRWGCGGLNIDGCRVSLNGEKIPTGSGKPCPKGNADMMSRALGNGGNTTDPLGRFPANVILDEYAGKVLDEQSGLRPSRKGNGNAKVGEGSNGAIPMMNRGNLVSRNDVGGASRFFYCTKASKADRGIGNIHPTVKPQKLMEYLVTLVTPPQGIVLDPFAGSGSTLVAAEGLGFQWIGFELSKEYCDIIDSRISHVQMVTL
jgi:DNA modification methylase